MVFGSGSPSECVGNPGAIYWSYGKCSEANVSPEEDQPYACVDIIDVLNTTSHHNAGHGRDDTGNKSSNNDCYERWYCRRDNACRYENEGRPDVESFATEGLRVRWKENATNALADEVSVAETKYVSVVSVVSRALTEESGGASLPTHIDVKAKTENALLM